MACEPVTTDVSDADALVLSDVSRIHLRRSFEGGEDMLEQDLLDQGHVRQRRTSFLADGRIRREMSGGAWLLDAMLYDAVSAPLYGSLDVAHTRPSHLLGVTTDDCQSPGTH